LVCRYWARLCRLRLFDSITLRSPDDANRFREILDAPALPGLDPVSELVHYLVATPEYKHEPWLHLVLLFVDSQLCHRIGPVVVEPLPSEGVLWRTLHPSLPRSLPGSAMRIWELRLKGLHFPHGRALAGLLLSIPSLKHVKASGLTFATRPTAEDFITPLFSREIAMIVSDDLQLALAFIPLFVASVCLGQTEIKSRGHRRLRGILSDDDLKTLLELISVFDAAVCFRSSRIGEGEPPRPSNSACVLCLPGAPLFYSSRDQVSR
jgi:hypothetical protein